MNGCRGQHEGDFTHLDLPANWGMQEFDLGQTSDESGTIGFFVVSLRLAAGVKNKALDELLRGLPEPQQGSPPSLYYKPGERTPLKDLPKLALPFLREDLEKLKAGDTPSNATKANARRV